MQWGSVADWVSAGGTILASVVALWIALRADRIRFRIMVIEVASLTETVGRLDIYLMNRGERPMLVEQLEVTANWGRHFLQAYAGHQPLLFAGTQPLSLPWEDLRAAVTTLTKKHRWRWAILQRLPRPVQLVVYLKSGDRIKTPIPPSTLARLRGRPVTPTHPLAQIKG